MFSPTGYVAEFPNGTVYPVVDFIKRVGLDGGVMDGPARIAHPDFPTGLVGVDLVGMAFGPAVIRPLRNGE